MLPGLRRNERRLSLVGHLEGADAERKALAVDPNVGTAIVRKGTESVYSILSFSVYINVLFLSFVHRDEDLRTICRLTRPVELSFGQAVPGQAVHDQLCGCADPDGDRHRCGDSPRSDY